MEAILKSPYFQKVVAEIGYEKAIKFFGLDKQQENPKYSISLGGKSINPMNMLKRAGLNQIFSQGLTKGALPFLGIGALAYGMNKAFPMSRQDKLYSSFSANKMGDPYGYASQMISGSGQGKDPFGINTVSAFGDYGKYQQNLYNKLSKKDNLSNFDKDRMDLAAEVTQSIKEDYRTDQYKGGNKNNSSNGGGNRSDRPGGSASFGQSFHGARGGIASL
jgi:hypothetical protein